MKSIVPPIQIILIVLFYFPLLGQNNDCNSAMHICSKASVKVANVAGSGEHKSEVLDSPCLPNENFETNSVWLKWEIAKPGDLAFVITPDASEDDLDFILYKLVEGIHSCDEKIVIRCMSSGENLESPEKDWINCLGDTGLRRDSKDINEQAGCNNKDDNYLSEINTSIGESYALLVNNYNSNKGFTISFSGSAEFMAQSLNINVENSILYVGDTISISDVPVSELYGEVDRKWDFGRGAHYSSVTGIGPHEVWYTTAGIKTIIQEMKTPDGCLYFGHAHLEVKDVSPSIEQENYFMIYPNPTKDILYININSIVPAIASLTLHLQDEIGRTVKEDIVDNVRGGEVLKMNLQNLPSGLYYLYIKTPEEVIKKKLVKI